MTRRPLTLFVSALIAVPAVLSMPVFASKPDHAGVPSPQAQLEPRKVATKPTRTKILRGLSERVLHVKFKEGSGVRLAADGPSHAGLSADDRAGIAIVRSLLKSYKGARIERLFARPDAELKSEKQRLQVRSGRELASKNLYYRIRVDDSTDLATLIDSLNALDIVEIAYPEPLPAPPPIIDDLTSEQGYLDPAPSGIDATIADEVCGARGENVRVIDIEYSWNQSHEDLSKAVGALIANKTPADPFSSNNHGTAVLGEFIADDNGFGVTGIVHEADLRLVNVSNDEDGYDLQDSIDIACANMSPGDVLLIEQQTAGANGGCDEDSQVGCVAVEWVEAYYDAIVACTAADIIVVEAAGNGSQNLDDTGAYGDPFPEGRADSWAIIVGAGGVDGCSAPERSRLGFSTFGSRVDLQGWGECVVTTGYGDHPDSGVSSDEWYTDSFGGTSSASPIVAAAAASVSSTYQALGLPFPTPPTVVRSLLKTLGTPQNFGSGTLSGNIGPLPDLLASLAALEVEPPELDCPDEVTAECTSPDGANVSFTVTATDDCDSSPDIECNPESGDLFPITTTPVSCSADDEVGNTGHCFFDVNVVDTTAPDISCPANTTVECTGNLGIDADDPQLEPFFDGVSATDICDDDPVITDDAPPFFGLGDTVVNFTATDAHTNADSCPATVTVEDTIPPTISVTLDQTVLWPPNHRMREINATVVVEDICDPGASFVLTSITSNEPDLGPGSGNFANDIQDAAFGTPDTSFRLRAERSGGGSGRIYTIVYTASDSSGNTATATVQVLVPHSQQG